MPRSRLWHRSLFVGALVVGAVGLGLWIAPSNSVLYLPDPATPADGVVKVPDEAANGDEGIYFVEVRVRKANLLERLFPGLHEGSTLVSEDSYLGGLTFKERRRVAFQEMSQSQQTAVAVALESLGYDVPEEGARVVEITEDYPADGVVRLNDVIVGARGKPVEAPEDLFEAMQGTKPGETVELEVRRNGKLRTLEVGTRASRDDSDRAVVGIVVRPELDFPVDVEITTEGIGGPSAGLAFALQVVDDLGSDLDRGRRVVVTGALDPDGTVAPIGGVKQKTFGARDVGADVFIVPEENAAEAEKYADGMEIVPVETFDEAVAYLRSGSGETAALAG